MPMGWKTLHSEDEEDDYIEVPIVENTTTTTPNVTSTNAT